MPLLTPCPQLCAFSKLGTSDGISLYLQILNLCTQNSKIGPVFYKRRMLAYKFPTTILVITLVSLIAIPGYLQAVPFEHKLQLPVDSTPIRVRRQNGNPNAAGDLYGIGIRVGAYLQVLGMLLSCFRNHKNSRVGMKLISSAVCVSLLSSMTVLVSNQNISPCEAWLILSLINAYGTPRSAAINHACNEKGGIAMLFAGISVVWQGVFFMWFFVTLVHKLPLLGTNNQVWFFTAVDILGWFRILMLVYSCFCCLLLPFQVVVIS